MRKQRGKASNVYFPAGVVEMLDDLQQLLEASRSKIIAVAVMYFYRALSSGKTTWEEAKEDCEQ